MKKTFAMILALCLIGCLLLTSCIQWQDDPPVDDENPDISRPGVDPPSTGDPTTPPDDGNQTTPPEEDKPLRILFLGNSLMFFNDMPSLFRNLAEKSGKEVYVDSVTRGSATISDFAHSFTDVGSQAYRKLQTERWDYVIIEPSRRITPYENTTFAAELESARTMQKLAASAGAEILLYCVWGNNDGTLTEYNATDPTAMIKGQVHYDYTRKMHVEFLKEVSTRIATELGGVGVIDAGYAFENSMKTYPNINLYDTDLRHPSLEGSYLAAACVYATIYNESPENIGFTGGTTLYFEMQRMAKMTVIDKVVPDLTETPEEIVQIDDPNTYDILFVGSDLINNYDLVTPLMNMIPAGQGLKLNFTYLDNTTGVFSKLVDPGTDFGIRDAFARIKYDAVVLQVSRRCTPSATDVEASELAALKAIYPLICENTDNVYLFTLNGSSNATIFTTEVDPINYSKTDRKENATEAQMNAYYSSLARAWAEEVGCKVILQGEAWTEFSPATDAAKGYLRACCFYNSIFEEEVPNDVDTNGVDATISNQIRAVVAKHCLPEAEIEPVPVPEYDTYDVLIIGSKLLDNADAVTSLADMVKLGQDKDLYLKYVTDNVGVMNKLSQKDLSDDFYSSYKAALQERKWDAVIIQISRRITPSSTDVEASELAALKAIYGDISANCTNVYLITLIATDNPARFSAAAGAIEYTKTDYKESKTASEMGAYYTNLANVWAAEVGCKVIDQGKPRLQMGDISDAEKGYLRACCYYNALFGEKIPADANTNGVSVPRATEISKVVASLFFEDAFADFTALNEAIAVADQKVEDQFTPNSWIAFADALANAKAVDSYAEQEEVDLALRALNEAMNALVSRADFTALNEAVEGAKSKVEANYTDSTWAALKAALETAEALDDNATQEQVDEAASALNEAIINLVVKADLTALREAIAVAEAKDKEVYTIVSFANLESALTNAKLLDENSPVQQVADATVALNEAIAGLVEKADLTELNSVLASVNELNADDYVEGSWQALQDAISESAGLSTESAQADVDRVAQSIKAAIDALEPIPTTPALPEYDTYDILFVGSDLIEDEYIFPSLSSMISLGQGKELYLHYVTDGVGVIGRLANQEEGAAGEIYDNLRAALAERKWDAIVVQFSRRCTPDSPVVEAEFNALKTIYPLLTANTSNIYLFTLNGSANPDIFTTGGISYVKTGETLTATAAEMATFYQTTVEAWCEELGCKGIFYGSSYAEFAPSTSKSKGFMRALCIYYSMFGEEMPEGTDVQGTSSSGVTKIKNAAAKYCLN